MIYARISQTADDVDKTANQVAELRALAASNGYVVADIFEDDDVTAYQGKAERPGYVALLAALSEGRFEVVMATEPQRLTRGSATELDALNVALVRAGAVLHTRAAGVQDPATPTTRALMQIMDTIGGLEVAIKTERQKARNRADRAEGLPPKGVRPFGWEAERRPVAPDVAERLGWDTSQGALYVPVRESEAEIIREAYRAVMDDDVTLWDLARRWTAAGVKTDKMGGTRKDRARPGETRAVPAVWVASTVRQVLTRPRNAGLLVSGGAVLPVSRIEPIVSRADWDALCARLASRAEAVAPGPGPKARSLLAGLLECACGERMHATISYSQRKGGPRNVYRIYRCRNAATDKTRKHSNMQESMADDAVIVRVLQRIAEGDLQTPDDDDVTAALTDVAERIADNSRRVEHVRELTVDPDTTRDDLAYYRGQLKSMHAERELLDAERDRLTAQRAEGGALAEFVDVWQSIPDAARSHGGEATGIEVLSLVAGYMAWGDLGIEKRREIVRGLFRVRLPLGGRGASRLEFTPLGTREAVTAP